MRKHPLKIEDYERYVSSETIERIKHKAKKLKNLHVTHVNSTYYGGGVAELLSSLTLLMNCLGIKTGWRVIQGSPDFFGITKKMHNAMQGGQINLSERKKQIYEEVICENAIRNHLTHNMVIIHDPQPLYMIDHYEKNGPWIWRCHVDMTEPNTQLWDYMKPGIEKYDAVVVSLPEYEQQLKTPQRYFMPAINPFTIKNRELSNDEIDERLSHYDIPTDKPIVAQISRFDKWKDPRGVIEAFEIASKEVDATLVLLGNVATDDPEGAEVYQSLLEFANDKVKILSKQDTALVNALQRRASVVLQKSVREGFGLTVAEAMWKQNPVIGGNVGGITKQIDDGENGFLVSSIEEAAEKIVWLVKNEDKAKEMGKKAKEKVRQNFLLTRLMEQYIDLFSSFETVYCLKD